MKTLIILGGTTVLACLLVVLLFTGIGFILSLFLPVTLFQAALLLMAPFCILLLLVPLLLIHQKMDQMMSMAEEDLFWDDDEPEMGKRRENKRQLPKKRQRKIIVMENSPILDRNAPCPCGSGEKFKNCCGRTGKSTEK